MAITRLEWEHEEKHKEDERKERENNGMNERRDSKQDKETTGIKLHDGWPYIVIQKAGKTENWQCYK